MSDDQLAKLAVAREKALAVRRAQKVEKLKAEAARLEAPSEEAHSSVEPVDAPPVSCCPLAAWIESAPSCSVMLSPWLPFRSALVSMNRLRLDMMCAILFIFSNHFCVRLWTELGRHVKLASLHDVIQFFLCVLLHKIVGSTPIRT